MVSVGDAKCIVPTLAIREAFRPTDDAITTTPDGLELARVRESFYPVIRLHEVLKKEPRSHELSEGILILLEYQDKGICLFVDEPLGLHLYLRAYGVGLFHVGQGHDVGVGG